MADIRLRPSPLSEKKSFEGIDLFKFLCAVLVVSIHAAPFGQTGITLNRLLNFGTQHYLARIAVPFFFVSTGFLVFRKQDTNSFSFAAGARAVWKMYRLYLIWTAIYIPLILDKYLPHAYGSWYGLMLMVKDSIFVGSYTHLWYLNASALALLLVSFLLHKRVKIARILAVSGVFYLLGLLMQSYYGLFRPLEAVEAVGKFTNLFMRLIKTTRSGLFCGFFFVSLGAYIAKKPVCISMKQAVIGFACSMALMLAEVVALTYMQWIREYDMYVFLVPAVFFLFNIAARLNLKQRRIYILMRKMSALVYFIFMMVRYIVDRFLGMSFMPGWAWYMRFICVLAVSMLISALIIFLSEKRRFKWLKKIYS